MQFRSEAIARKSSLGGGAAASLCSISPLGTLTDRTLALRKQSTEHHKATRGPLATTPGEANGKDRIKWLASRSEVVCVVGTNKAVRPDSEPGLRRRCSSWAFGGTP